MPRKLTPDKPWTRKEEQRAIDLRRQGWSIGDVAKELDRSYATVSVKLSNLGATTSQRGRRKPGKFRAKVAELCKTKSDPEIARILGSTHQEVYKARCKLGLPSPITYSEAGMRGAAKRTANRPPPQRVQKSLQRAVSPLQYTSKNNVTALTDVQRELACTPKALALAEDAASRFGTRWPSLADESFSVACLGLCQAARSFDPSRGLAFTTHARQRIQGALLDLARSQEIKGYGRNSKNRNNRPTVSYLGTAEEADRNLDRLDALATYDDVGDFDSHDDVYLLTRNLPPQERRVMRMLFTRAECATYGKIAEQLDVSESRIAQIVKSASERLRKQIEAHENAKRSGVLHHDPQ